MALEVGLLNVLVSLGLADGAGEKLAGDIGGAVAPAAEKAGRSLSDKLSAGLADVGKKASLAITAPLVGLGTKSVLDAQKISAGLAEVVSLTGETGATALTSIRNLSGGVADLSGELGIAQEILVGGLYQSLSAGVPRDNVFEFLRVAGQAAIAGVTDTETAVDGLTTIINAFGLKSTDASAVADSLFTAVKGGKTTFAELSAALFNVAPAAAAAGVDFQTVNAAIAALTSAGVPTSVATTQIRAALVGLQRPSEDLDKIFNGLGYSTRAAALEGLGLQDALGAVRDAAGGDQGALQQLLGSVEAVGATNILAGTGAEKFSTELKNQATAAGATKDAFDLIDQTRGFDRLKVDLQNLSVTIGTALLPFAQELADMVGKVAAKFQNLSPRTQDLIIKIAAVAAAIGPVLIVASKLIGAIKAITGVVKALSLALTANPWVLVGAAAVGVVLLIIRYWEPIKQFFSALWEGIKRAAQNAGQFVADLMFAVADLVTGAWNGVIGFFGGVWDAILFGVKLVAGALGFGLLVAAVEVIRRNWSNITSFFSNLFSGIVGVVTGVVSSITGAFSRAWDGLRSGVQGVYDFIAGIFTRIADSVSRVVERIKAIPGDIASGGLGLLKAVIPGFADGGTARGGQPAIVGERGPELIIPRRTSTVIPNQALGGLAGVTYSIVVNNPVAEASSTSIPAALRRASYLRST